MSYNDIWCVSFYDQWINITHNFIGWLRQNGTEIFYFEIYSKLIKETEW